MNMKKRSVKRVTWFMGILQQHRACVRVFAWNIRKQGIIRHVRKFDFFRF